MPRTSQLEHQPHPLNSWTDITIGDLQRLQRTGASGLVTRVWIALKTYAWNRKTCFPSIKSIAERIGYDLKKDYNRTIGRALKWLEDHQFIKRKHRRSRERFTLQETGPNSPIDIGPNSPEKQTKGNNTHLTPNPLAEVGDPVKTKKQKVRDRRRRRRQRRNPVSARIAAEVAESKREMEAQAEWNRTLPARKQAITDEMRSLHSNPAGPVESCPQKRFYAAQHLYFSGEIDELPKPEGDWDSFTSWILDQVRWDHDWLRVFPIHSDALGLLRRHFERSR